MSQQTPNPEAFQRAAKRLKEACYQLDSLKIQFDELIAKVAEDIRHSSLTQYRLRKAKQISELE